MLFSFLYRHMKGLRLLVMIAILITVIQVGSDLLAAMPLKFIPSKVNNPGSDPACTFPFLDGFLSLFDQPIFDPSLKPSQPGQIVIPPISPCPATGNPSAVAHPVYYHHSVIGVIIFSLLMLLVFGLLSAFLTFIELNLATYIAQQLAARLRSQLFEHMQRIGLNWHDAQKTGDLVQRVSGNISDIEKLVTDGLVDLLAGSLTLVGVAIIMSFISPQYTLLSLCIGPLLFLIVIIYTRAIKAATRRQAKAAGEVAMVATEDVNALPVIRAFTLEKREDRRFRRYVLKQRAAGLRAGRLQAQFTPLVAVLVVFGTAITIGVGGYVAAGNPFSGGFFTIPAGSVDIGTLVLFLTYLKMLYQPMRDLSKLTNLASNAGSGAERIQEVFDQEREIVHTTTPYDGPEKLRGEVTYENVIFSYMKDTPVLKGITLHIPAGKRIALVGLSGGGKTTMVKLIPRFYEAQTGTVKIDGIDNREYPLMTLRQNVSIVLQESVLFEGTFRDNIEVGRPGANLEDIVDAAKRAQIHETIMDRGGYDAEVYEQGKNLSLGQRQRIAIARAILRDAPILILDEPTASMDVEAEGEVMRALDQLIVGRTVIMISHRLSTLGHVDEIVVVRDGQIVEQGTYRELKKLGGFFAQLLEEQNRYNIERLGKDTVLQTAQHAYTMREEAASPRTMTVVQDVLTMPLFPEAIVSDNDGPNGNGNGNGNGHHSEESAQNRRNFFTDDAESEDGTEQSVSATQDEEERDDFDEWETQKVPVTPGNRRRGNHHGRRGKGHAKKPQIMPTKATSSACVEIRVEGKVVSRHDLNKPGLSIGREATCDIRIRNRHISRQHAKIVLERGAWIIEDVDSLNGLIYRGRRVDRLILNHNDQIYIAPTVVLHFKAIAKTGKVESV